MEKPPSLSADHTDNTLSRRRFLKLGLAAGLGIAAGLSTESCAPRKFSPRETSEDGEQSKSNSIELDPDERQSIQESIQKLKKEFLLKDDAYAIVINPENQTLYLVLNDEVVRRYIVSTAKAGIGSIDGSGMTPHGTHTIYAKLGENAEKGTIFHHKKNTGTVARIEKAAIHTKEYVTTRVLLLEGEEEGINRGGSVDSRTRNIYIHGTPEEGLLGQPESHGCIRMNNDDVTELYSIIPEKTLVEIQNKQYRNTDRQEFA